MFHVIITYFSSSHMIMSGLQTADAPQNAYFQKNCFRKYIQ